MNIFRFFVNLHLCMQKNNKTTKISLVFLKSLYSPKFQQYFFEKSTPTILVSYYWFALKF